MCCFKLHSIFKILTIILFFTCSVFAQNDTRVGEEEIKKIGINYFNYSDPDKINIEVIVLGGVRNPGKYLIPKGTTVIDILGLAGNMLREETADNIKLIRNAMQGEKLTDNNVITLKYRDLFKDDPLTSVNKYNPVLIPGDILIIPIPPTKTFWDYVLDVSTLITPFVSIATLIITIITLSKQ
jgi:hypothetical protein